MQLFLRFTVVFFPATPVFGARSNSSDIVPIIAGVLGAIFGVFLLGLLYFCFVRKRKRDSKLQHCANTHYPPHPLLPLPSGACFLLIPIPPPHLSSTEMAVWCLFIQRGLCVPGHVVQRMFLSRIYHRNALTEKAWKDALPGLGNLLALSKSSQSVEIPLPSPPPVLSALVRN